MFDFRQHKTSDLALEVNTTLALCRQIDSPRSIAVYLLLKNKEYQQYLELTIDPDNYDDPSQFRDDYLVTEILRKSPNLPLGVDRSAEALLSFSESEHHCQQMNNFFFSNADTALPVWFFEVQTLIKRILGPLNKEALDSISDSFGHGPGATTGVRGVGSCQSMKFDKTLHLTANLRDFYRAILGQTWWEHQSRPEVVSGSKFTTVPKSAKTDRGICVEPTLNMFVQKGIGSYLRSRLRSFGYNLDRQAEVNKSLAQQAVSRGLSTIDLSAASDSVSLELVRRLLPPDWYHLLVLPRSPTVELPSGINRLEKFSSMGNGFTFELETLLFLATTLVICKGRYGVSVFGDDIICPQRYAPALIEALNFLGFKVNTSKSFLAGNFFESCGSHWFKGADVRPFYLKGSKSGIPYPIQIANRLRLYSRRCYGNLGCDPRFKPVWLGLIKASPRSWRGCRVPEFLGDVGVISSFDEARPESLRDGHEGWSIRFVYTKPVQVRYQTIGTYLSGLARSGAQPDFGPLLTKLHFQIGNEALFLKGREALRGYLGSTVTKRVSVSHWPSGFDWV
jgi:hypothetical protein